jgi:transposase-like protein
VKKRRKNRHRVAAAQAQGAGAPRRYDAVLQRGQEQLEEYYKHAELLESSDLSMHLEKIMEEESDLSMSEIAKRYGVSLRELYAGITTVSKDRRVISYYSRPEIQNAIFSFARDRKIAVVRNFRPMFQSLRKAEDIPALMLCISESYTQGRQWPSMHGTVARYDDNGQMRGFDFVAEIDFKRSWATAFDIARPLVKFFRELGVYFLIKFSGHCSPHIIVPAEAVPEGIHGFSAYRSFIGLVAKKVKQSSYLDRTFSKPSHFLRLPYSIHELTGKVSLPIRPEDYDSFSPKMAQIGSVEVLEDWWPPPEDARERNQVLMDYMSGRQKQVAVGTETKARGKWEHVSLWEQMVESFQKNPPPEGRIRPVADDSTYSKIIQEGQKALEHRESLLKDQVLRSALQEMIDSEHPPSIKKIAREHGVDSENLWFLWRWALRQDAFDHYSQPRTQQAIYNHIADRKVWLPAGAEIYMDLREPSHILPLVAYIHSNQSRRHWPGFQCTKGVYNPQTHDLISADITMDFGFRNGTCDRAIKIMKPLLDILESCQVTFSVNFSGDSSFHIVIPSAAIPKKVSGKRFAFQHHLIAKNLSVALRKIAGIPKGVYSWEVVPYQHTYVPYCVNESTGSVCVPVDVEELESFSPEMAQPPLTTESASSPIPENAPQMTEAFLRKILA